MSYCNKCGDTGKLPDGTPCTCRFDKEKFFSVVDCMDIPEQYRGLKFNKDLISSDMPAEYGRFMEKLYNDITSLRLQHTNYLICTPSGTGKSIFSYSCIESLFNNSIGTFPLYDVLEIKRCLLDMDFNRKQLYAIEHPEDIYEAPYVFIKLPAFQIKDVLESLVTILDRRVRRGHSTIFLYNGCWTDLLASDYRGLLKSIVGDGSYGTIKVESWSYKEG